jgi:ESF2/ABP1 family protein
MDFPEEYESSEANNCEIDVKNEDSIEGNLNNNDNNEENAKKLKINNKNKNKRGIVYLSHIPIGLNVNKIRQLLSQFGEIDRIYLERDKSVTNFRNKKKSYNNKYIEGWIEFKRKSIAKLVAKTLNGTQIGGKRKNKFYDSIWSLKYLHKYYIHF